jgi:hypothetical protein
MLLVDTVIEDLNDVRTAQRRGRLCFVMKTRERLRHRDQRLIDQFDRYGCAKGEVFGLPNGSHPSSPNERDETVFPRKYRVDVHID